MGNSDDESDNGVSSKRKKKPKAKSKSKGKSKAKSKADSKGEKADSKAEKSLSSSSSESNKKPSSSKKAASTNANACVICGSSETDDEKSNAILLCVGCSESYHMRCLKPPLSQPPQDLWLCPTCVEQDSLVVSHVFISFVFLKLISILLCS